ncbi:MAG: hypothetical protein IIY55_01130, partial [Blautia sp.]|nr:hypothetical protein [Blautia sp.]
MKYRILEESRRRIRIHLYAGKLDEAQAEILEYAFSGIPGVKKVTVYRATGNCALEYDGRREAVISRLDAFHYQNVRVFARETESRIDEEEMTRRKLSPQLKRKLRIRVALETAADMMLPVPMQLAY